MTAQATPISVTGTAPVVVSAVPCTYRGLHIFSTPGATVTVYDNASGASGTILAKFTLAAGGDKSSDVVDGLRCANGIYVTTTAAIEGSVRIG